MSNKESNDRTHIGGRFVLFPAEIIIFIFAVLGLLFCTFLDVPPRDPFEFYVKRLFSYFLFYVGGLFVSLLVLRLVHLERSRKGRENVPWKTTLGEYRRLYLSLRDLAYDLRFLNCVALTFLLFINFKHLIPLVNPGLYDQVLLKADRLIFSGQISGEWLQNILGLRYTEFLSTAYVLFYSYTLFLALVFILQRNESLRQEFFASFVLLWFLGILIVYCFPTMGPCFYVPEHFAEIPACRVKEVQTMLWNHKLVLDEFPKSEKAIYAISGFPSLHLAVPILGAAYLKRFSRFLAWLSWLFVGITIVTTLYFGWHYLLDDVGSFLLVFFVIGLTQFIFKKDILTGQGMLRPF